MSLFSLALCLASSFKAAANAWSYLELIPGWAEPEVLGLPPGEDLNYPQDRLLCFPRLVALTGERSFAAACCFSMNLFERSTPGEKMLSLIFLV